MLQKWLEGKEAYQGKLLEARQNDYKDEAVLVVLTLPIAVLAFSVWSDDPDAMTKVNVFFRTFCSTPELVYKFMDSCRGEHLWH
jgi:hypothetical protein